MNLQIKTELKIAKPIADVFEAIVDNEKMSCYFTSKGSARMEPGRVLTWHWADYGVTLEVKVQKIEKDRLIAFLWSATGVETSVEIELTSISEGVTSVKIIESGWDSDEEGMARFAGNTRGWVSFLYCLKAFLEYGINLRKGAF